MSPIVPLKFGTAQARKETVLKMKLEWLQSSPPMFLTEIFLGKRKSIWHEKAGAMIKNKMAIQ